jgi:hypothetical protein
MSTGVSTTHNKLASRRGDAQRSHNSASVKVLQR